MVVGEFTTELDVLVIGAGPGGYVAAIRAAQLGKKVAIVDKSEVGGVCLNRGCIPSKSLISAAHRFEQAKDGHEIGINVGDVSVDMKKVQEWKQSVVSKLTGGVRSLLKGNGVEIIEGEALFVNENEVRVFHGYDVNRYHFNHCIIATGSRPIEIPALPFSDRILSSTEALTLDHIPNKLLVVGGGYIGIELGTVFAKLGAQVTVLEGSDGILPGFEKNMVQLVKKKLKKLGVEIHTNALASSSEVTDNCVKVTAKIGDKEEAFEADYCLVTVGRRPNTDELGLEAISMKMTDRGLIEIDKQCKTNVPNVYAIGDIVAGPALAHKASYEGKVAAEVIAGMPSEIDYLAIPAVVFSDPEMASVGLTEDQAKAEGYNVKTGRFSFGANGRALSVNETDGFVKVVADEADGRVLGVQIVGPEASDLIAEAGLAIEMGATLEDIALTIHAHPTLAEVTMEAVEAALGHGVHSLSK
ncbi:dihydrolipoamide dehydrogenase [Aneurinibacillus soli]|uniref:Dihydrolipoyl dehydrogenase n=1 Tax=Aneurinibacillus soli TaxID=1500254 RepID=A0A0U5AY13_9BACL|nr:dihydrolipoyl dehydrogenase [Aneurinibacillus soli]PYE62576.1 dihydrolipoamide dehydrogenase [Aneurinibacillus soli]BAU27138.1 Dihydrolipoyl dehydrogenase [Aneurinibacillus soli]